MQTKEMQTSDNKDFEPFYKVLEALDSMSDVRKKIYGHRLNQAEIENPVLVGPDSESEQWVSKVAADAGAPFIVLEKTRHGDRDVEVSIPQLGDYKNHRPVLVDDIISTARTMIETVAHLKKAGMNAPVCIGVHAVFAGTAYEDLEKSGAEVVTCNTIPHESNQIDLSNLLAEKIVKTMRHV